MLSTGTVSEEDGCWTINKPQVNSYGLFSSEVYKLVSFGVRFDSVSKNPKSYADIKPLSMEVGQLANKVIERTEQWLKLMYQKSLWLSFFLPTLSFIPNSIFINGCFAIIKNFNDKQCYAQCRKLLQEEFQNKRFNLTLQHIIQLYNRPS